MFSIDFSLLGITAPLIIWMATVGIVVFGLYQCGKLSFIAKRFRFLKDVTVRLRELKQQRTPRAHRGLDGTVWDSLRQQLQTEPGLMKAWDRFQAECLEVPDQDGGSGYCYYRTRPAGEAFSELAVIDSQLNRGWCLAIPGILTGLGLLFTFLSILMALKGLRVGSGETIEGIKPLITGLSGKFLSSIAALALATLYTLCQIPLFNTFSRQRGELCLELDELVPRRDTADLVREIAEGIGEQTKAFKNFGTTLTMVVKTAFSQGMSESIGPQQERMVIALEGLNKLMLAAETTKQESITGELASLLRNLESSMTVTMNGMGERFSQALTGNASSQMERVIDSLGATASMVDTMNAQSAQNQATLSALLAHSRDSSMEQVAMGKQQVEELSETLRNLMTQLNDSAGTSVNQMSATLTAVVADLSAKVGNLGNEVSSVMRQSSEDATGAARQVLERASSWSAHSETQLQNLIERLGDDATRADLTRKLLDQTLGGFQQAIQAQGTALGDMRAVASQMAVATTAMAGTLTKLDARESVLLTIAQKSADQVAALERSATATQRMTSILEQYTRVFAEAERASSDLIGKVGKEVQGLTTITQAHFQTLVTATDNHLGDAVQKLGGSVSELGDTLDDFNDVINRVTQVTQHTR